MTTSAQRREQPNAVRTTAENARAYPSLVTCHAPACRTSRRAGRTGDRRRPALSDGEFEATNGTLMKSSAGKPILDDLAQRFDSLPSAPWGEAPQQAMLVPIARPGSPVPAGVLVLAISPRRIFDDAYRRFFELIANHVAAAVSNARAYEEQRERAEKLAELDRAKTVFFNNVATRSDPVELISPGRRGGRLSDPPKTLRARRGVRHRTRCGCCAGSTACWTSRGSKPGG